VEGVVSIAVHALCDSSQVSLHVHVCVCASSHEWLRHCIHAKQVPRLAAQLASHMCMHVPYYLCCYFCPFHSRPACRLVCSPSSAKISYCCLCQLACFLRVCNCHRRLTLNPCQRQHQLQRHMTWDAFQALKQE